MARVLVTGCSSGIGRATARLLAEHGHHVVGTARDPATLTDLPVGARLQLDVTDQASIERATEAAGEIDILVNNAGLGMWGPLELSPISEVERLFDTNVLGVVRMCQAVLPGMRARKQGRIIQISSGAARRPQPLVGLYCSTKAAVESYSMALRIEVRAFGIDVAVVEMGAIDSDLERNRIVANAHGTDYEGRMNAMLQRTQQLRSRAYPAEAAAAVVASVAEAKHPPFRTYVGEGFGEELAKIAALDDEAYEDRFFRTYCEG